MNDERNSFEPGKQAPKIRVDKYRDKNHGVED
jgi:hypothetical protein